LVPPPPPPPSLRLDRGLETALHDLASTNFPYEVKPPPRYRVLNPCTVVTFSKKHPWQPSDGARYPGTEGDPKLLQRIEIHDLQGGGGGGGLSLMSWESQRQEDCLHQKLVLDAFSNTTTPLDVALPDVKMVSEKIPSLK